MSREQTVFSEISVAKGICDSSRIKNLDAENEHTYNDMVKKHEKRNKSLKKAGRLVAEHLKIDNSVDIEWVGHVKNKSLSATPRYLKVNGFFRYLSKKMQKFLLMGQHPVFLSYGHLEFLGQMEKGLIGFKRQPQLN